MFDRYTEKKPRPRWLRLAIAGSIASHIGVVAALLITAMWQIDKLAADEPSAVFVGSGSPAPAPAAGPPPVPEAKPIEKPKKVIADLRQPDLEDVDDVEVTTDPVAATSNGTGVGVGDAFGAGTGTGTGFGTGDGPGDGWGDIPDVTPPDDDQDEEPPIERITETMLDALRTKGETKIYPPDPVKATMIHEGQRQIRGAFELCIDTRGTISNLRVVQSMGYPRYDRKILATMRHWRYRPYMLGGEPVAACGVVTYVYRIVD